MPALGQRQVAVGLAVRVRELPRELLRGHLDDERIRAGAAVLREHHALTIEIAVTSTAGIAVHTISSVVWPWVGGPSESSSGAARKLMTEYAEHRDDDREHGDRDHRR